MHPIYPVRLTNEELARAAKQMLDSGHPLPTAWQQEIVERLLKFTEPKTK